MTEWCGWTGDHDDQNVYLNRYTEWQVVNKLWSALSQHTLDRMEHRYEYMVCMKCGKEFRKSRYRKMRLD